MEDAGTQIQSFMDYLRIDDSKQHSSSNTTNDNTERQHNDISSDNSTAHRMSIDDISTQLIDFLYELAHIDTSSSTTFDNPMAWNVLNRAMYLTFQQHAHTLYKHNTLIQHIAAQCQPFTPPHTTTDTTATDTHSSDTTTAHTHRSTDSTSSSQCQLTFGDLWPNSIYMDHMADTVWILDWELCRYNVSTADIRQLLANMWLMEYSIDRFHHTDVIQCRDIMLNKFHTKFPHVRFNDNDVYTMVMMAAVFMSNQFWQIKDVESAIVQMYRDLRTLLLKAALASSECER
jgi:hypothetical protein